MRSLVEKATNQPPARFEENPTEARKVIAKALLAARARLVPVAPVTTRRKSALEGAGMPDKLEGLLQPRSR